MSKIAVQMPQGTSSVSVGGQSYEADESGLVHVELAEHVAPLVAAGGIELTEDGVPGTTSTLIGSDSFPALVKVPGQEEPVQLGDIVREAHAHTGISVDEWNNLPPQIRDMIIGWMIALRRGELGNVSALQADLDTANARIAELEAAAQDAGTSGDDVDAGGNDDIGDDEAPEKPSFDAMTKAQINEWLVANQAEEATGDKDAHVAAAEAQWLVLHPATEAGQQ